MLLMQVYLIPVYWGSNEQIWIFQKIWISEISHEKGTPLYAYSSTISTTIKVSYVKWPKYLIWLLLWFFLCCQKPTRCLHRPHSVVALLQKPRALSDNFWPSSGHNQPKMAFLWCAPVKKAPVYLTPCA